MGHLAEHPNQLDARGELRHPVDAQEELRRLVDARGELRHPVDVRGELRLWERWKEVREWIGHWQDGKGWEGMASWWLGGQHRCEMERHRWPSHRQQNPLWVDLVGLADDFPLYDVQLDWLELKLQ
jgi:hypothetical protein